MFARLAALVMRYWLLVLVAWVAIAVALKLAAPSWKDISRDGEFAYLPDRMTSARGEKLIENAFPTQATKSDIVIVVARQNEKLHPEDKALASRFAEQFAPKEGVASHITAVRTFDEPIIGGKLISPRGPNGQAVLVVLQLDTEFMVVANIDIVKQVFNAVDSVRKEQDCPKGLELGVTGSAAIGSDMLLSADESIHNTELWTICLVVLILLLVYRAPGLVIVPLVAIGAAFTVSTDLLALLAQWCEWTGWCGFRVFATTKIFIVVILFGAATDYCLFLIARYREELQRGLPAEDALREALGKTGHALTASAMTTILGLGAMVFADFGKYRYGGPTIAMSLVAALVACLTVAPALLRALGRVVFWPLGVGPVTSQGPVAPDTGAGAVPSRGPSRKPARDPKAVSRAADQAAGPLGRFWQTVAQMIITHPGVILVVSFFALALPAYQGMSVPVTYDVLSDLSPDRVAVRGTRLLARYFSVGETGPITFLAYRGGCNFDTPDMRRQIALLTNELRSFSYVDSHDVETLPVESVRSLTNPLGGKPQTFGLFTPAAQRRMVALNQPQIKGYFLSTHPKPPEAPNQVVRFDLVCRYDPFSLESIHLLTAIDKFLQDKAEHDPAWEGTSFDFIGTTAGIRDLREVNASDTVLISILVSLSVLGVLVFLLRRPIVSLYLIFTVLFGFFVSLGLTKLFFAWYYGDTFQGLDWKLPIFLFVILVAVGEDYNIYLVTRVFEEQRRRGVLEGLRVAVVRTGGIITSCGVIMAGTFASMATGTLRGMFELGFSLSLGVLLDTFIIRTILVPSFLALWDSRFGRAAQPDAKVTAIPHFDAAGPSTEQSMAEPASRGTKC
ncbi:MAG: MMPL family transporter [Thermoguttaceae bacterium]|jgi:RND superfamily putative drug exporter